MGVIYKLTEEVVCFIVETKKANKKTSCRSLAQLASEKFDVKVSKSSVNNVLKHASLSDSVGRKPGKDSSKKFKIPSQKKQDLAESLKKSLKTLESKKNSNFSHTDIEPPISKKLSILEAIKNSSISKEEDDIDEIVKDLDLSKKKTEEVVSELPTIGESKENLDLMEASESSRNSIVSKDLFLKKFNNFKQKRKSLRGGLVSGIGYVFLKAAQWELFGSQGVSGVFDGKMFSLVADIQENLERMFIFEVLGNKFLENAGSLENHFLCKVSDVVQGSFNMKELDSWTKIKDFSLEGMLSCFAKAEVSLMRATGFCLVLDDGTKLFLDVRCGKIEVEPMEESQGVSLNLALIQVSKNVIGGGNLFLSSFSKEALWEYSQMCQGIEGKKIKKVSVFDCFSQEMVSFSTILNKERNFCIIEWISPANKELWVDRVRWAVRKPFYHVLSDKGYCYCIIDLNFLDKEFFCVEKDQLKGLVLWRQEDPYPFVCLNYVENRWESEKLLKAFLEKNVFSQDDIFFEGDCKSIGLDRGKVSEKFDLWDMLRVYIDILKEHCAKSYFNVGSFSEVENCFKAMFYNDFGYLLETEEGIAVDLLTSVSGERFQDLCLACKRVNQRIIRGPRGRKLHVNIRKG